MQSVYRMQRFSIEWDFWSVDVPDAVNEGKVQLPVYPL